MKSLSSALRFSLESLESRVLLSAQALAPSPVLPGDLEGGSIRADAVVSALGGTPTDGLAYYPAAHAPDLFSAAPSPERILSRQNVPNPNIHALAGIPANPALPSANVGQEIAVPLPGATSSSRLIFPTLNGAGAKDSRQVAPARIDSGSGTAFFIVPADASSGDITVNGSSTPLFFLQVVPTLVDVDLGVNQPYWGGSMRLRGSGFSEGDSTVHFGDQSLADTGISGGIEIGAFFVQENDGIGLTVPEGVPFGPIWVSTSGGSSPRVNLSFVRLNAVAQSGIPADNNLASANPGQAIILEGQGFDATTSVVFMVVDDAGNVSQRVVKPLAVNDSGTQLTALTPLDGISGPVSIVADNNNTQAWLQIVPVLDQVEVTSLSSELASVRLRGSGFVEGHDSIYTFGQTGQKDVDVSGNPINVYFGFAHPNDAVNLTLDTGQNIYGAVSVTTAGGTSAPWTVGFTALKAQAYSGQAGVPNQASANPGQVVSISGSRLSSQNDVVLEYVDSNGTNGKVLLPLNFVNVAGTQGTFVVPGYANGAFAVHMFGSSFAPQLQIVPLLKGIDSISATGIRLRGAGFEEGNNSQYLLGSQQLIDQDVSGTPINVYAGFIQDNDAVQVTLCSGGLGVAQVRTAGGLSAPLSWPVVNPNQGRLLDVAFDPASGQLWTATDGQVLRIDPASGAVVSSFNLPGGSSGSTGLEFLAAAMTLAGVPVPAGSLLITNGGASFDKIYAVSLTGTILATLDLKQNLDPVGGVYEPVSGHLFLLDNTPDELVEVDPANGTVLKHDPAPFDIFYGGVTLDPATGHLWIVSSQTTLLAEMTAQGQLIRVVDAAGQGPSNELSGLAFKDSSHAWASSNRGVIYLLDVAQPQAPAQAVLGSIPVVALEGQAADPSASSVNVGQVVEVLGSNFTDQTRLIFPIRDNAGVQSQVSVSPMAVSGDGKRMQAVVPDLAQSGLVRVSGQSAAVSGRDLGFNSWNDSIYRGISLEFIAGGSQAQIEFSDGGLQGLNDESWGLDNVSVAAAAGGAQIFSDDFEGSARPEWSSSKREGGQLLFSQFSGRFSNESQKLTLNGLTAGGRYVVRFDLYIIDSWDGSAGPDEFIVQAGGQTLFAETFSNIPGLAQSYQPYGVGQVYLQVVPVISGIQGQPGQGRTFNLLGSGFMEGASTVKVGGQSWTDQYVNQSDGDVSGARNSVYQLRMAATVEGPIEVRTAGGSFVFGGPVYEEPAFVEFQRIESQAAIGQAANSGLASANAGQEITLAGRGFTSSTVVEFAGVDDRGVAGLIRRTGTALDDGRRLTVVVPALARSGLVRVVGAAATVPLQVVPVLRSTGGPLTPGKTVLLEGSGLVEGELSITIDGQKVRRSNSEVWATDGDGQQVVKVVVPTGLRSGVIEVRTGGGSFALRRGVAITEVTGQPLAQDAGDTLAAALPVVLPINTRLSLTQKIGDNSFGRLDVDLYQFAAAASDTLILAVDRISASLTNTYLRLFDSSGKQLAVDVNSGPDGNSLLAYFRVPAAGIYYVGVSSYANVTYDPKVANSGNNGNSTGDYRLTLQRNDSGTTSLGSLEAVANQGTPARAAVASANTGQSITIRGSGFLSNDRVVFTISDGAGRLDFGNPLTPTSVADDGQSLVVVVPTNAVSGAVRLQRESTGLFLQVVPTLVDADMGINQSYWGGSLRLRGSGFSEGDSTVHFGDQSLADTGVLGGIDIGAFFVQENDGIGLTVPEGVPFGPIWVSTSGGSSPRVNLSFVRLNAVAQSGIPADNNLASANPGQAIVLEGQGFDATTSVVFMVVDDAGNVSQRVVKPLAVNDSGTQLTTLAPLDGISGPVSVVADNNNTQAWLQIVPVLTSARLVNGDLLQLRGAGFVEGHNSQYIIGSARLTDSSASASLINVGAFFAQANDGANVTLRQTGPGSIAVKTAGGTSSSLSWTIIAPKLSTLYDLAVQPGTGSVWVATSNQLYRIDAATGASQANYPLPGSNASNVGLQVLPAALSLNGVSAPAGSLLVVNGSINPDKVYTVNPDTGTIVGTLDLGQNFDAVAGAYDAATGHLFILHGSPDEIVEIDPAGATIVRRFPAPFSISSGGLAINPVTGNLWVGSSQSNEIAELGKDGTLLRKVDISAQGPDHDITGLSFAANGQLFVSSIRGLIYEVTL